jgi:hypothetical protein
VPELSVGIIPAQGYRQEEKHSIKAMQWIKYLSTTEGVCIQYARNGGEKEIGPYKVDGYCDAFPLSNVDIPLTFQVSFLLYGSLV